MHAMRIPMSQTLVSIVSLALLGLGSTASAPPSRFTGLVPANPLIMNGQATVSIRGVRISNPSGACITVTNSYEIIIEASELGPCAGPGVAVVGSSTIKIVNSSIHTERDGTIASNSGVGVYIYSSSDVLVQGNEFASNESSVYARDAAKIRVVGNYSLNPLGPPPRGQHVQFNRVRDGSILANYGVVTHDLRGPAALSARQEDAINLFESRSIEVRENYLVGGDSPTGCGIVAEGATAAGHVVVDNVVIRTAQCGIGIAGGVNYRVQGNKILDPNIPKGSGNVGIYVWNLYPQGPCSGHSIVDNYVSNLLPVGRFNDYWDAGNCGLVTLSGNRWADDARRFLLPEALRLPPPPIPPRRWVP